jgi:hypothetical protein
MRDLLFLAKVPAGSAVDTLPAPPVLLSRHAVLRENILHVPGDHSAILIMAALLYVPFYRTFGKIR